MFTNFLLKRTNNIGEEKIIFQGYNPEKFNSFIYPVHAGITYPNSNYFMRINEGDPTTPYMYVMEYVTEGKGYIVHNDVRYTVKKGDFYMISRNTTPFYYSDENNPFAKKWINICGTFITGLCHVYGFKEPIIIKHVNMETELDHIHHLLSHFSFSEEDLLETRLAHIILDIFEKMRRNGNQSQGENQKATFKQISQFISDNINLENISRSFLESYFFISGRTLDRLFQKNAGMSPAKYILTKKIEYAQYLLLERNYSVEDVSSLLHFSDARYFRHVFIEQCGKSPLKWKKEHSQIVQND